MQNETGRACSHHSISCEMEQLTDEENDIFNRILKVVNGGVRKRLPALQKVNKKKLKREVKRVNQVLEKMDTEEITNTNDLIYAGAFVVTEELGLRGRKGSHPKEPNGLRRDLSSVEALLQVRSFNEYHRGELERMYKISEIGLKYVSEDLKQRITAKAT